MGIPTTADNLAAACMAPVIAIIRQRPKGTYPLDDKIIGTLMGNPCYLKFPFEGKA